MPEGRLDNVAKLCELSSIDPEDEGAQAKAAEAVRAVLGRVPELTGGGGHALPELEPKLTGGVGTGSAVTARRPRRDAFERGFLRE